MKYDLIDKTLIIKTEMSSYKRLISDLPFTGIINSSSNNEGTGACFFKMKSKLN